MLETIEHFLDDNKIDKKSGFIIAVSGGADSIAALHAFKYLNFKILALHCNFNLRGQESNMDEQFVKRFCDKYGIPLSVKKFNTIQYAKEKGISIEMAARDLRYEWFEEMRVKKKMDYIVVGHHSDDMAETIFINICRGTGIKGLTGIKAVNGHIIRPLLTKTRAEIVEYVENHKLGFRTDSTNNTLDYVRNKIRHLVLPIFKEINPSFLNTVQDNCKALKEAEEIFIYGIEILKQQVMDEENGETLINIEKTIHSPAPFTLLFEILKPFGFNNTQIKDILDSSSSIPGKRFESNDYVLTKGRKYWRLFKECEHLDQPFVIPNLGYYEFLDYQLTLTEQECDETFQIPNNNMVACFDVEKITFPLTIRHWQRGDWFCPLGMKKSKKKISDFFTDQKYSEKQKRDCLLLLSEDNIIWVLGHRIDERYKIRPITKKLITMTLRKK